MSVLMSVVEARFFISGIFCFFLQAEDGRRDLVRSRGLGDVYKRQLKGYFDTIPIDIEESARIDGASPQVIFFRIILPPVSYTHLTLPTIYSV